MTVHVFICPRGCRYAPGYVGREPVNGCKCHRCSQPMVLRKFEFELDLTGEPQPW